MRAMSKKKNRRYRESLKGIRETGRVPKIESLLGARGAAGPQAFKESGVAKDLAATFAQLVGERLDTITVNVPPDQLEGFLSLWRDDERSGRSTLVFPSTPEEPTRSARRQYPRLVHMPDEDAERFSLVSLFRSQAMAYLTELGEGSASRRRRA